MKMIIRRETEKKIVKRERGTDIIHVALTRVAEAKGKDVKIYIRMKEVRINGRNKLRKRRMGGNIGKKKKKVGREKKIARITEAKT